MRRFTRNLLLAAAAFTGTLVTAFQADAFEPLCIRQTSSFYRDAVRQFESEVYRSRFAGHGDRLEVRRLRLAADRFHSSVRHHNDSFRYASSWQDLSDMHCRIERSFIAGCRQSDPHLFHAWTHVSLQYDRLSEAIHFQANAGRGRPGVWDRGGHDRFDHDRFGRDWHNDDFHDDFRGRDSFGHDPFGHDSFGSRHSVARPAWGPSVLPIRPVPPIHGFAPHVDPRREAAAAITAAVLQRLLN